MKTRPLYTPSRYLFLLVLLAGCRPHDAVTVEDEGAFRRPHEQLHTLFAHHALPSRRADSTCLFVPLIQRGHICPL